MEEKPETRKPGETAFLWLLLVLSVAVLVFAVRISGFSSLSSPGAFPMFVGAIMIFSCVMALREASRKERPPFKKTAEELRKAAGDLFSLVMLGFTFLIVVYGYLLGHIGFLVSTLLFLWTSIVFLKGAPPFKATWVSLLNVFIIYLLFRYVFLVLLP